MRNFLIFILSVFTFSCNDGDVISVQLDFDKNLTLCGDESSQNYILFDTKSAPFESLTLLFSNNSQAQSIFNTENSGDIRTINIDGSSVKFNYRTYNADPNTYICQDIPDANVSVINNYEALSGYAVFTTTFLDDDNDGVPTALEFDGDTDNDGIPNYKDNDDDGDNVPTINEKPDPNGDGDLADMQDTDGDLIPDYLDNDDDGDGTLTKFEDENNNGNLFDDLATGASVARFLDNTVMTVFESDFSNLNEFSRDFTVNVTLENIDISILSTDSFFLGFYEYSVDY
ncbi:MAG: hypothetical protein HON66_02730 [Formosa sp.]|jgi:hypothetical protein|nr:hypothetical protein [Formosa sp.]MDB2426719.1 hypothetical protein [Flavobacteriaceae bacterium]MDC0382133.1 hypothetical protein [Flavobacteriaceae bacterium]MDC3198782.1 hypothetical protein [Flavobacteriaceae bacterium]MDC3350750.1 hypothetical protein [Flavobacteriaceae bacterium]|tara:strand:+ start:6203 stop:7060 length:858 start_codon:yes stop_codon:yes gene_type:complete